MSETLTPYSAYKESTIPWLKQIPAHWEILPLCAIAKPRSVTGQQDRDLLSVYLDRGVIRFSDVKEKRTNVTSDDLSRYQAVDPGDLVLNNQQAWRGSVGVSRHIGIVSPAYLVLSLDARINSNFANLLFRERTMVGQYLVCSKGVGSIQRNLYWPYLKRVSIFLPPPEEQAAIARYLDYMDRRIRRYISVKQKLIKLLTEQKQAIIHQAVTRGLDPDVPLKESGVEWLGQVPAHWEVIPVGAATSLLQTGPFGSQLHSAEYVNGGIPMINPAHMKNGRIVDDPAVSITLEKMEELKRHRVSTGDIIAARRGELGRCVLVREAEDGWLCGTGSFLIRCKESLFNPAYFQIVFSSQSIRDALSLSSVGATMDNLNAGMVARLRIQLPPLSEQQAIVEVVESQRNYHRIMTEQVQREIDLIREYRTRLIADVVTGKVDVRAAASLPVEMADEAFIDESILDEAMAEDEGMGTDSEDEG
jgi:type I restriction enzyme, S subunit